jgi:hypothetical protein
MGPLGVLGNLVWLLLAGWWLALGHLITTVLLACTIVGIPFAWAHVKLAGLALWPIGKMIVPHRTRPCDTRAGGDAIMLSCRNEMTRRTGRRGGDVKKSEGVKLRPLVRPNFAKHDNFRSNSLATSNR